MRMTDGREKVSTQIGELIAIHEGKNFENAIKYCRELFNGTLASLHDKNVIKQVSDQLKNNAKHMNTWNIGLKLSNDSGNITGKWHDGTVFYELGHKNLFQVNDPKSVVEDLCPILDAETGKVYRYNQCTFVSRFLCLTKNGEKTTTSRKVSTPPIATSGKVSRKPFVVGTKTTSTSSPLTSTETPPSSENLLYIIIPTAAIILLLTLVILYLCKRKKRGKLEVRPDDNDETMELKHNPIYDTGEGISIRELPTTSNGIPVDGGGAERTYMMISDFDDVIDDPSSPTGDVYAQVDKAKRKPPNDGQGMMSSDADVTYAVVMKK